MKYTFILIIAFLIIGCSKDEDPVSLEGSEQPNVTYLYNGSGIFDSVASTGGYTQKLGNFSLYGEQDSLFFSFSIKTDTIISKVTFRSDSDAMFQVQFTNFIADNNYHNYTDHILKPGEGVANTYITLATGFRKYIVVKDLKVYLK
jgi:hypothetical protein